MAVTLGEAKPFLEQANVGQAAQQAQLKQQVQQLSQAAPAGQAAPGKEQLQAAAADVTKQAAQPALQAQQQAAQQAQQARAQQAQENRLRKVQALQKQKQDLQRYVTDAEERLGNLNIGVKHELYDSQMKFAKDKMGRTTFTQQQLLDWTATKARNEEDFRMYEQTAQQMLERQDAAYNQAYKVVAQELQQQYDTAVQQGNWETAKTIQKLKVKAEQKMKEAKAKASANAGLWSTVGAGAGLVVGGVLTYVSGGSLAWTVPALMKAGEGMGQAAYSKYGDKPSVEEV